MSDQLITIIYDHYKNTCSTLGEAIKRRDRLMLFVLLALGFFAFQAFSPTASNIAVSDFLNFKFGLTLKLDFSIIGDVVWFLLLIFTVRYFQVAIFVERQYTYIHKVEDRLNNKLGDEIVTREGKSYLDKYPRFSNWMWMLYTIVFPVLLLLASTVKIISELKYAHYINLSLSFVFDTVGYSLLTISIILYLTTLHKKLTK